LEQEAGYCRSGSSSIPEQWRRHSVFRNCCEEKTGRAEGPAKIAEGLQAASNLRKRAGEPERQLQNKRP